MTLEKVERLNLDKYTSGTDHTWVNVNKLVPQGAAGVVVVGPEGSGKTNEVMSMLLQQKQNCLRAGQDEEDSWNRYVHYDQMWIWTMDVTEKKYELTRKEMLKRGFTTKPGPNGELPDFILTDDFSLIPDINDIDKTKQTVIIFDDLVTEGKKTQKPIIDFYKGARKRNCQLYYLAQGFFEVPKMIRRNTRYFWIYRLRDPREFAMLATSFELHMPKPAFKKVYLEATQKSKNEKGEEEPSFLFVNVKMRYVPYRFRRGFGQVLSHVPM